VEKPPRHASVKIRTAVIAAVIPAMVSCKAPSVNLATEDPIKVDIAMRLDVYQHANAKPEGSPAATRKPDAAEDPASRRRNRMADIQTFKNDRIVGENREGFVSIRDLPQGEYGDYVRKTVEAENADRLAQMNDIAEARKTSLPAIQKEQAELWRNRAFKGEFIEVEIEPGVWQWTAKEG
jgi:uncharacterized protein YdbL (DUF1318 family)